MNPYASYILAALNITKQTKDRYPLEGVHEVSTSSDGKRVYITTKGEPENQALQKHPSFFKVIIDEDSPDLITYEFGVPTDTKAAVEQIVALDGNVVFSD